TLAEVVREFDWDEARVESQRDRETGWVDHVLRREAETLILPNLAGFFEGAYQPQDNNERLALLGICQSRSLYGAAARLYADAFAADPGLADSLNAECLVRAIRAYGSRINPVTEFDAASRYLAARCAALSGGGCDGEARALATGVLDETERTRLRKQAREW